ncbi:hypothetical protein D7223_05840 [Micromonospora endolithica]|uniref:Uncharacterized protein n=2 Tax=Micromonospora endolithica TaxID=230091 RepID=A0A3A9ZSM0_9ACTN|nr:hypothetical protein D7223_05840 [Micromonospora endolithica]
MLLEDPAVEFFAQADGHHKQPVSQVFRLAEEISHNGADMVVGNRYGAGIDLYDDHRLAITKLWSQLVNITSDYELHDVCCGMRVYSRRLAERFVSHINCFGYGLEVAQLLITHRAGWKVVDKPVDSARQAMMTAAEKLEDNLAVLLDANLARLERNQRLELCRLLAEIKLRRSLVLDGGMFGLDHLIEFHFAAQDEDGEDAYSLRLRR